MWASKEHNGKGFPNFMTSGKTPNDNRPSGQAGGEKQSRPEWADGLRQIYDSVLEEPLPDSFNDLLARLDDPS